MPEECVDVTKKNGVTTKEHILQLISANDRRYDELRIGQDKAVNAALAAAEKAVAAALAAQEKAVSAALAAAEKAVNVAEINAEKWRDNANEWRAAMTDRERNFFSRGMGYVVGALTVAALLMSLYQAVG